MEKLKTAEEETASVLLLLPLSKLSLPLCHLPLSLLLVSLPQCHLPLSLPLYHMLMSPPQCHLSRLCKCLHSRLNNNHYKQLYGNTEEGRRSRS